MKKSASYYIFFAILVTVLMLLCTACGSTRTGSAPAGTTDDEEPEYTYHEPEYDDSEPDPDDYLESTPESTCFSAVGYDWDNEVLYVQFRDSGSIYAYDAPSSVYDELTAADSMGGYYNACIKGQYTSSRIS